MGLFVLFLQLFFRPKVQSSDNNKIRKTIKRMTNQRSSKMSLFLSYSNNCYTLLINIDINKTFKKLNL